MTQETPETKAFIKRLHELDRSKHAYEKFRDFCEMSYCALAKVAVMYGDPERADVLESRYMQIVGTYQDKDTVRAYPELLAMTVEALETGQDFLGSIASQLEFLDARQGQFITPQPLARLTAEMLLHDVGPLIEKKGFITLSEPACGAGGMVLAAADILAERGFNPSLHMLVHAVDVSPLCYHMSYIQLTYKGIAAFVERANTLSLERFESAWTLLSGPFYAHHGRLFPEDKEPPEAGPPEPPQQLRLF